MADAVAGRDCTRVSACTPVTVRGEPDALRRTLDNLLDNAEIHGPRGGEVSVSLTVRNGVAALAVRDEGPGLDPGDLEHAFERFWRAPEAAGRPGTGLGLAHRPGHGRAPRRQRDGRPFNRHGHPADVNRSAVASRGR